MHEVERPRIKAHFRFWWFYCCSMGKHDTRSWSATVTCFFLIKPVHHNHNPGCNTYYRPHLDTCPYTIYLVLCEKAERKNKIPYVRIIYTYSGVCMIDMWNIIYRYINTVVSITLPNRSAICTLRVSLMSAVLTGGVIRVSPVVAVVVYNYSTGAWYSNGIYCSVSVPDGVSQRSFCGVPHSRVGG